MRLETTQTPVSAETFLTGVLPQKSVQKPRQNSVTAKSLDNLLHSVGILPLKRTRPARARRRVSEANKPEVSCWPASGRSPGATTWEIEGLVVVLPTLLSMPALRPGMGKPIGVVTTGASLRSPLRTTPIDFLFVNNVNAPARTRESQSQPCGVDVIVLTLESSES